MGRDKKGRLCLHRHSGTWYFVAPQSLIEIETGKSSDKTMGIYVTPELYKAFKEIGAWENEYKNHTWLTFPRRITDQDVARTILKTHPELRKGWKIKEEI